MGSAGESLCHSERHGKCHREYTAGGAQHGDIAQGNLRDVFEMHASFGKGEKVG